jgi:hypothetical protein
LKNQEPQPLAPESIWLPYLSPLGPSRPAADEYGVPFRPFQAYAKRRTHLCDKTHVKVKNEQTYSLASLGKIDEVVEPRAVLIVKFWYFDAMAANQVV